MKYKLEPNSGEKEVIIRFEERDEEIESLIEYLEQGMKRSRILGEVDHKKVLLEQKDVLYFESIDKGTFAYTKNVVARVEGSLAFFESHFADSGFYRCSKSMVINVYQIEELQSESGNRILATMDNGEKVMISRRYARGLRQLLRGGESMSRWERYLSKEIGIEFKACLYFFAFLFFYCLVEICKGNFQASMLIMAEMIFANYVMGYI